MEKLIEALVEQVQDLVPNGYTIRYRLDDYGAQGFQGALAVEHPPTPESGWRRFAVIFPIDDQSIIRGRSDAVFPPPALIAEQLIAGVQSDSATLGSAVLEGNEHVLKGWPSLGAEPFVRLTGVCFSSSGRA